MYKDLSFDTSVMFIPGAFDKQEELDIVLMANFFKSFPKKFKTFFAMPSGFFFDAMAISSGGKFFIIENKERDEDFDKYEDCFIEPKKLDNLRSFCQTNPSFKPLYINYKGDEAEKIYVWDLSRDLNLKWHPNVKIKGKSKREDRWGLQWNEANIFTFDAETGKYIMTQKF